MIIKIKPADSHYERGTDGGQVTDDVGTSQMAKIGRRKSFAGNHRRDCV